MRLFITELPIFPLRRAASTRRIGLMMRFMARTMSRAADAGGRARGEIESYPRINGGGAAGSREHGVEVISLILRESRDDAPTLEISASDRGQRPREQDASDRLDGLD